MWRLMITVLTRGYQKICSDRSALNFANSSIAIHRKLRVKASAYIVIGLNDAALMNPEMLKIWAQCPRRTRRCYKLSNFLRVGGAPGEIRPHPRHVPFDSSAICNYHFSASLGTIGHNSWLCVSYQWAAVLTSLRVTFRQTCQCLMVSQS